jgi:hypothetical protein
MFAEAIHHSRIGVESLPLDSHLLGYKVSSVYVLIDDVNVLFESGWRPQKLMIALQDTNIGFEMFLLHSI